MKITYSLRKGNFVMIIFAILLLASSNSHAQNPRVNAYIQRSFTSPFVTIKGAPGSTLIRMALANATNGVNSTTLPFDFDYDGTLYTAGTTVWINQAGSINFGTKFGTASSRIDPYFGGSPSSYPSAICPYTGIQHGNTGVSLSTTGAAPNRIFTLEWSDVSGDNGVNFSSTVTTAYQIKLYETSNTIEFWYKDFNFSFGDYPPDVNSAYYQNVGLNGGTSPNFTQLVTTGDTNNFNTPSTDYRYLLSDPELAISPKKYLDFGTVSTGASSTQTITLTNVGVGTAPLTITGLSINGSNFTLNSGLPLASLAPGQSDTISVTFTPKLSGPSSAILNVVSNGLDSGSQQATLTGVGFAPNILVDTATLFFKPKTPLGSAATRWIHIHSSDRRPYFSSASR